MFQRIRDTVYRHRQPLMVVGAVGTGVWLLGKYLKWKVDEMAREIALEQTATKK
jgi:hypothetical protein